MCSMTQRNYAQDEEKMNSVKKDPSLPERKALHWMGSQWVRCCRHKISVLEDIAPESL